MIRYVLDTDTLTPFQRRHPAVCHRVAICPEGELAITVISVEEQLTGWYTVVRRAQSRDELANAYRSLADTIAFLADVSILSFSVPAILRFEQLRTMRLNVRAMDLRIAAIALERGCIVVARNTRDFRRVPSLMVEGWSLRGPGPAVAGRPRICFPG